MSKKSSAPTMKDVAQEAGVALGTVSKVVNGLPVGEEYKKRVEEAIHKLGYQVNSYAKGLKSSKTHTIAFLVPDTITPFFAQLTFHINQCLAQARHRMLLCATEANAEMEQTLVNMAEQNQVDGIICLSYNPSLTVREGTRLITIDRHLGRGLPCVSSDNLLGGKLAVEKLAELGCRNLLYMNRISPVPGEVQKRREGFVMECQSRGLTYTVCDLSDPVSDQEFLEYIDQHFLGSNFGFDGIFCGTDYLACVVRNHLVKRGVKIPEDVQLIGFDGIHDYITGDYLCSTIVQPIQHIAQACVDLVLSEEGTALPSLVCLPVTYAFGGTTKEEPWLPKNTNNT